MVTILIDYIDTYSLSTSDYTDIDIVTLDTR